MKRVIVPVLSAVVAAALIGLLAYGLSSRADDLSIEQALTRGERPVAASRKLPLLRGGGTRSLADLRGKVVVLNFWASWCVPCEAEAPVLDHAQKRLQAGGRGTVLGVTRDDASADSLKFVREHHVTYPSVRDVDTNLARDYASRYVPETFVIDRRGRIAAALRGPVDRQWMDEALNKAQR